MTEEISGKDAEWVSTHVTANMPVCGECIRHRRTGQRQAFFTVATGIALFILGGVLRFRGLAPRGSTLYWVAEGTAVAFVASLVAAPIVYLVVRWLWLRANWPHVAVGRAVGVVPLGRGVLFIFKNDDFGAGFADENSEHLVSRSDQPD
ncbi:MAG TPA: hypothetical protein VNA69_15100 [Thermoanaerobaculia bacterium]|nr:hypothetical protein [Thermoanaerobaculia bacterium]